jgi:hypothetical protein
VPRSTAMSRPPIPARLKSEGIPQTLADGPL